MSRDQQGQAGGVEALAFGVLVFIVGTLLVANAWSVIDAKMAASAAAREGARTYVETGTAGADAGPSAGRAVDAALTSLGRSGHADVMPANGEYRRCGRVVVRVTTTVPVLRLPLTGVHAGRLVVTADHAVLVDPYRTGLPGVARC